MKKRSPRSGRELFGETHMIESGDKDCVGRVPSPGDCAPTRDVGDLATRNAGWGHPAYNATQDDVATERPVRGHRAYNRRTPRHPVGPAPSPGENSGQRAPAESSGVTWHPELDYTDIT